MRQELTTDIVERYIEAPPDALYDFISDVTRTPERTPDIVRCEWLDGATGPAVGARSAAVPIPSAFFPAPAAALPRIASAAPANPV